MYIRLEARGVLGSIYGNDPHGVKIAQAYHGGEELLQYVKNGMEYSDLPLTPRERTTEFEATKTEYTGHPGDERLGLQRRARSSKDSARIEAREDSTRPAIDRVL